ncbi:restriction endonuclease subunit S [Daejeonella sp.]|uniref:restriction endonuclease subunit S n=1 Tax=Daejeonella sp. TaxID=2805397 RepID=UPI0030BE06C4
MDDVLLKSGLPKESIKQIQDVFGSLLKVDAVLLFGSRAKGSFTEGSDIDLAVKGRKFNHKDILSLNAQLEELNLPYKIDLLNYNTINEPDLVEHIHRVGVVFYERWKSLRLEEITEPIKNTYTPDGSNHYRYIGLEHIGQKTLRLNSVGSSSDVTSNKFLFQSGDVLFGKLRPYFRKVVQPEFSGICSTDIWVFRAKDEIDQDYLFYFLANWDFVNTANGGEGGTRMPRADWNHLKATKWRIPPVVEQKIIASTLGSLDDKIHLLQRQNKTLEELAENVFDKYSKESIKSGKIGTIEDEFDFTMGQSPAGDTLNENEEGIVFFQGRSDFGFRFPEPRIYTTDATRYARKFDTLISVRAPVGDMNMAIEDCSIGRGVSAFRYKFNDKYYSYTYYKLRSLMRQIKQYNDTGTVFGSIGKDDFKRLENVIFDSDHVAKFQREVGLMDEKIYQNTVQIASLNVLRDSLLSKLINGEIRIINY